MSHTTSGNTYRSSRDWQEARLRQEAEELRNNNRAMQQQANRLGSEVSALHGQLAGAQNDLREAARIQARLEQKQREYETIQQQLQRRQQEFETRTKRREQELEREIHTVEAQADRKIQELRAEVQSDVDQLRQEVDSGLNEVRAEVEQTRQQLTGQIENVRQEVDQERHRRQEKETTRAGQAGGLADWVEARLAALQDVDALGLTVEKTRVQQALNLARERLSGADREAALPTAETAFTSYQTAYLEVERRIGEINGVAEHIQEVTTLLTAIASNDHLRMVFAREAAQLEAAVEALRARAQDWRTQRRWTVFEYERDKVVNLAHDLLARAMELEASVTGLLKHLQAREQKLKYVSAAIAAVVGAADSFELGYANPADVKSARLIRARLGGASVDTYLELDGTYRVDAYGFTSATECSDMARLLQRKMAEEWTVTEARVDPSNPQRPTFTPPPTSENWQRVGGEFERLSQDVMGLIKHK